MAENTNPDRKELYQYAISGDKGVYQSKFQFVNERLTIECSCGRNKGKHLCWHTSYVLSGKTSRLTGGDIDEQQALIHRLEKNNKDLLAKARRKFAEDTACRRCNSSNITKINKSLWARIRLMFREQNHTYYCKDCGWTW